MLDVTASAIWRTKTLLMDSQVPGAVSITFARDRYVNMRGALKIIHKSKGELKLLRKKKRDGSDERVKTILK